MSSTESRPLPVSALPGPPQSAPLQMLKGIIVLDLTTSIAGPYGAQLLGDLGADVLKIEKPKTGDDARAWGPPFIQGESLWFLSVNRNKRSIALDYTDPRGREVLQGLIRKADVLLLNIGPRVQSKLHLSYADLVKENPRLIHASITGFGLTGSRADLPCYDLIAEGYSSVMDLTGEAAGPAQKVGTPAADMLAGQDAAMAIIAALFERTRTQRGTQIDVALVDSMTRFMTPRLVSYLGSGELLRRSGGRDSVIAIYQTFETADEPLTLGLGNDGIWQRFCAVIDKPSWTVDARFASNAQRRAARAELVVQIQAELLKKPRDEWLRAFAAARVPAGPINRADEVVADPELLQRLMFYAFEHAGAQQPQVNLGIRFAGSAASPQRPPPRLGEHTAAVLQEVLGLSHADLASLQSDGIVD